MTFTIQTFNHISATGLSRFPKDKYNLNENAQNPTAILCRSANLHEHAFNINVEAVGRAGAGTNNIPVEKLTEMGVPVFNTPGANANAVKELVLTGMLLASRHICPAWDFARQITGDDKAISEQVEKNKKQFQGCELPGKTLGVIGLGNIGARVANVALDLGMKVIGYDPAITVQNAWMISSDVAQAEHIDMILKESDFISLHIPLNAHTKNLIDAQALKKMKKTAVLLNFSRDGIVDNAALRNALVDEQLSYYVCDFPTENLKNHSRVISLPHLGASTQEAEENCAVMVVDQVRDYLEKGHIKNSVNFPNVKLSHATRFRLCVINKNVPKMVAQISTVLSDAGINIADMINKSRGDIAYNLIDMSQSLDGNTFEKLQKIDGVLRARQIIFK